MTGVDQALLRHLLQLDGAWEIADYQLDLRKARCDVWIGPQVERGWFGRPKRPPTPAGGYQHEWQHVSFGAVRFVVHLALPAGARLPSAPWAGTPGLPFTAALAQQVFTMFNEGVSLQLICSLLKLSLNDVWRYRFALESGRAQVHAAPAGTPPLQRAVEAPAARPTAPPAREPGPDAAVPDVADPVWMRLVNGELSLDVRVLSLKLMLARTRSQFEVISDDEVRLLKLRDLHRYFVKNERVLVHELRQLRTVA